jgi:hypothetical protein
MHARQELGAPRPGAQGLRAPGLRAPGLRAPGLRARGTLSLLVGVATAIAVLAGLVVGELPSRAAQLAPPAQPIALEAEGPLAAGSEIVPGTANRTSISLIATYDVNASIHYGDRAVAATSIISLRNASGGPIDRVELNTVTARIGALRVTTLTVDGRAVVPTIDDQTIVVPLGGVLPDGASTVVRISIRATLRSTLTGSNWLFTRVNGIVEAARWLPWVSLRRAFNRPNHGDPFITASSPFVRVRLATDRAVVVASTGLRVAGSGLSQTFEARNVRDFNLAASPYYRVYGGKVGSTLVRVYAKSGYPASTVLSYAKSALSRMGSLVGTYPYPTFKVAQSAGGYGMESPQLIWIPGGDSGTHLRWLVHHETAHQWFYGIVGNDQARQPFDDEAAADHMARYFTGIWQPSRCSTNRLDLSIYAYSATCYFQVIYVQGALLLDRVRQRMGTTAYWRAMRAYVAANRYGIATTKSLLATLDANTPFDLRPTFAPRFPSIY